MTQLEMRRCAVHPGREAHTVCERCGNYACQECVPPNVIGVQPLCVSCQGRGAQARYHVVPVWRYVVLNLLTFGTYQSYWMYRVWKQIKAADRSNIMPIARTIFGGVTYFYLISDLNVQSVQRSLRSAPIPIASAIGYLISGAAFMLPEPYGTIVPLLSFVWMIPALQRIWELADPDLQARNARWSTRHAVVACLSVPLWALIIAGLLLPTEPL